MSTCRGASSPEGTLHAAVGPAPLMRLHDTHASRALDAAIKCLSLRQNTTSGRWVLTGITPFQRPPWSGHLDQELQKLSGHLAVKL